MERPAFEITVTDHGDRVTWKLTQDDDRVDGGSVSLDDMNLDSAWAIAWLDANSARRVREDGA